MGILLPADVEEQLLRLANQTGRTPEEVAADALRRVLDYEERFRAAVAAGLASVERGDLLDHGDVVKMLEARLPGE
jgi:predicted transcriptional regulator